MEESAGLAPLGPEKLVLGFDGGCFTCSGLARRVKERAGDRLEVRSLRDPEVARWREQCLGQNAPWTPTLFRVRGGEVRAWTGWRLGVVLGRHLGPATTWRVLQALGEVRTSPEVPRSTNAAASLTRGRFLKGVGGGIVALSIISGTNVFARFASAAEWVHPLNRKKVASSEPLQGRALRKAVATAAASRDVQNIWTDDPPGEDQIGAARHTYEDGNTVVSVSWVVGDQLLIHYLPARAIGNYRSQAMRIKVIPEEAFVLKATSVNGRRQDLESAEAPGLAASATRCRRCRRWRWGCVALWANGCSACSYGSCPPCAAGSLPNCVLCLGCLLLACGYGAGQCCRRWA